MADLVNPTVLTTGMGAGYNNGGLLGGGGDGIGALLIGALLFGGGLGGGFGNRNGFGTGVGAVDGVVTPTHLQSALNQQMQAENTNHIMQHLAQIQAAIPAATCEVQLSASANTAALSNQAAQGQLAAANSSAQGQLQVAGSTALLTNNIADARHNINDNIHAGVLSTLAGQAGINALINQSREDIKVAMAADATNTAAGFAANALAIANSNALAQQLAAGLSLQGAQQTCAIQNTVRDDGDRTRSLIIAQNDAYLNRIIVEQANALIELKNERHTRESGITLQQTVNQAQNQNQAQQQQQQQFQILGQIAASLNGLTQIAHATNQNVIAGNTGAVTTGAQNANPVNVA
jgi:hypothetical protein